MNQKSIVVLGGVAVLLLGVGFFVSQQGGSGAASAKATLGGKVFPELASRINDVGEVTVASKDGATRVTKSGSAWGLADKGGYPVDFDKVKELVVGISEMEYVAEMTKNPANHAKLGVEDPSGAEATSKHVTLKDAGGAVLADVVLGKPKPHEGWGGEGSLFVRKQGDDQAWEVTGQFNVASDTSGWMQREISKLESARVQRVVVQHPDGNVVTVSKTVASDANYTVENVPEGKELQWPGVGSGVASALQYLSLDDVQKNENFDASGATTAEFTCFDGMVVTAKTIEKDGKSWVLLSARFDEALRTAQAGPPAPPPAEGETAPEPPKEPELKSVDDVKKEVDELNAKWSPWVYSVPGYNAANLRKKMTDMLKADEPPAEPAEPAGEHGADDGHDHDAPATDKPEEQAEKAEQAEKPGDG